MTWVLQLLTRSFRRAAADAAAMTVGMRVVPVQELFQGVKEHETAQQPAVDRRLVPHCVNGGGNHVQNGPTHQRTGRKGDEPEQAPIPNPFWQKSALEGDQAHDQAEK
mmetsp:Transcript_18336/g.34102  ORF Transcript_18336/g.34102 Transcript_18336/m.34102 type:complete len:108 (+) Transcript_18336:568-891(+)